MDLLIFITLKVVEYQLLGCAMVGAYYLLTGSGKLFLRIFDDDWDDCEPDIQIISCFAIPVIIIIMGLVGHGVYRLIEIWFSFNWSLVNLF